MITVTPETSVTVAARIMNTAGLKSLPVVTADGRLLGVVSRHDVLKVFVRSDEELERQIHGRGAEPGPVDGCDTCPRHRRGTGQLCLRRDAVIAVGMTRHVDVIDEIDWDRDPG